MDLRGQLEFHGNAAPQQPFPALAVVWEANRERSSVLNIRKALARFSTQRKTWRNLVQENASLRTTFTNPHASHLEEVHNFGSNPGDLRMFTYLPPEVSAESAL